MKQALLKPVTAFVLFVMCGVLAFGQVSTTGSINGTVTDQSGAVVPNATVLVRNNATGAETTLQTADNGTFSAPALPTGTYTVTITAPTFKQTIVQDVKVNVGTPSGINVALEAGGVTETVTITGGGGELLQTQTVTVGTTITGRQITDIPFTSRDALDLVLLLPGTNTPGTPRTSTVNGLPKGALNITVDGVNVQDNVLKSDFGGGFFTYVRPRIDAIDEVTVSTATPGAESSGEGAVQIKFVTRSGGREFHGSLYEYHRNPWLNANYWWNNRAGIPRDRVLLNQYGARVGGPIYIPKLLERTREKLFFFTNYEEYRLPEQTSRQRFILNETARSGIFTTTNGTQVNLLTLAARINCNPAGADQAFVPCTSTLDPITSGVFQRIRASTAQGSVQRQDNNRDLFTFTNTGGQVRRFAAVRFDYNITDKHHFENTWNYQRFGGVDVDFLNSADPAFPGFTGGVGGQNSHRWSNSTGLRSNLTSNIVNEFRVGLTGGNSLFRANLTPAAYADQGGFSIGTAVGTGGFAIFGLNNPNGPRSNNRRNSPVKTFTDTVTWVKGEHTFNFGGTYTRYSVFTKSDNNIVPALTFGVNASDPANRIFQTANFPAGTSAADITAASNLYALLVGRITAVSANSYLDEETGQLRYLGSLTQRLRQNEYGLFGQDSWRVRPNLTLNLGLRWEVQEPWTSQNEIGTFTTFESLFGRSGVGNLFRPGLQPGARPTEFNLIEPGRKVYNTDYNNFLPSVGIAWSPDWKSGILNRFFGGAGQSVLRAGYSIATVREGLNTGLLIFGNPGQTVDASRDIAFSDPASPGFLQLGALLRDPATTRPVNVPALTFPYQGLITDQAYSVEPNLRTGYVQSWTAGFQREITKDMVFEARYVGNRGVKLWNLPGLNEVNAVENGFGNEFRLAMQNLVANNAFRDPVTGQATRAGSFAYFGPGSNTSPLPIFLGHFRGCVPNAQGQCTFDPNLAAQYTSANFRNATFVNALSPNNANVLGIAALLSAANQPGLRANFTSLNPNNANFFRLNPDKLGGVFLLRNTGRSYYDAMQLELRRRMAGGLLVQGSYTWSKALTNVFGSNSLVNIQPPTLRDDRLSKTLSNFDIRHAFKVNWIYELPFGRGRHFLGGVGKYTDWLVGGWDWHGAARVQSGTPINFGNVQLVGMTRDELQAAIDIRKNGNPDIRPGGAHTVNYLPDDIIVNTVRAFNTTSTGFALGAPTGRYIAPASSNGCIQVYVGSCGFSNLVVEGPRFVRFDMSVVKRVRFTETKNLEGRVEFLNAFNNINFRIGAPGAETVFVTDFATAGTFGSTTQAYRDISTTNDPGGRIIQLVLRFNF